MIELRPCIVHIPELKDSYRVNKSDEIKTVIRPAKEYKGYFQKWADRSDGKMSETVAIVEYEDGTVHEVYPRQIRFTDR